MANIKSNPVNIVIAKPKPPVPPGASVLAKLATGLGSRQWVQLPVSWPGGSSGYWKIFGANESILAYANRGEWDPVHKKMVFLGAGYVASRLAVYDDGTDTWAHSDPSASGNIIHIWDHSAFDVSRGIFYGQNQLGTSCFKLDVATMSWSTMPGLPMGETRGVTYFPEIDALIAVSGPHRKIYRYNHGGSSWSSWVSDLDYSSNYHGIAEYDPVRKQVYFGGGSNNPYALYKLSAGGVVSELANSPLVMDVGGSGSNIICDPVSGHLIVKMKNNTAMAEYDPDSNKWSMVATSIPSSLPKAVGMAVPISTYGVIMFVAAGDSQGGGAEVWLYRH